MAISFLPSFILSTDSLPIQFSFTYSIYWTDILWIYTNRKHLFKKDILLMNPSIILFLYWRCFSFYDAPCRELCVKKKLSLRIWSTLKVKKKKNQGQLKASIIIIIIIEVKHLRWNEMGNGFIFIVWLENDSSYLLYDGNPNSLMLMTLKTYPHRLRALFYFCFKSSNITSLCSIITTGVVIIKAFSNALVDRAEEIPF